MAKSSAYPTLDGLFDLACREGVEIRPTLLRVLTDLYVQTPGHSADEEAQYVELATRLIEAADATTRAAVKARLSAYPKAPTAILRLLANAVIRPAEHAAPVRAPAKPDLIELFFMADAEARRLILLNLDVATESEQRLPAPAASELIRRLENAALQRNTGEFSRALERALAISHALAERIVRDYSGEPIVVAAKALAMPADVFQRILLFLNPAVGQSVGRVYELARLYDELALAAAARMLEIWRGDIGRAKPAHAPLYYDDERRGARAAATPAEHRAVPRRDLPSAPAKSTRR